ncbi:tRNA lysidine(34) synthetase TilS [soil metagenome]
MFEKTDHLLVACSGGVDSVVLCDLLFSNGYHFSIAHCNFQLRGKDSDNDEIFVKSLGEKYRVTVYVHRFDTDNYARTNRQSIQVAARELRYQWFNKLLIEHSINYLLTAHHADDNIETVLMNVFKGTGITGMHGILAKRDKIARPLLFATKKEILEYAKTQSLAWVEDVSNATDKYTRNFFRHHVIPLVETVMPNAANNVLQTNEHLKEAELLYKQSIAAHQQKLLEFKGDEVHIPVLKFAKVNPFNTIAYEIIKSFGFSSAHVTDLKALLQSDTGKYIASATHRIIKNRKWLIIAPLAYANATSIIIEQNEEEVLFENGKLSISISGNIEPSHENKIATIDAKQIKFPMLLRRWKAGDYFYPLGMKKKKKIARFLIDLKLSKTDKEKVWVVESNQKIVWVIGYRIDDRFKITNSTKIVLKVKWVDQ